MSAGSGRETNEDEWRDRVIAARAEREQALVGREDLVSRIEALFFDEDPISINFGFNTDEYQSEAQSIVIRLPEAASQADVQRIVHEEFVRWFDPQFAGPAERYRSAVPGWHGLWCLPSGPART